MAEASQDSIQVTIHFAPGEQLVTLVGFAPDTIRIFGSGNIASVRRAVFDKQTKQFQIDVAKTTGDDVTLVLSGDAHPEWQGKPFQTPLPPGEGRG
jgi:hypothetical protein